MVTPEEPALYRWRVTARDAEGVKYGFLAEPSDDQHPVDVVLKIESMLRTKNYVELKVERFAGDVSVSDINEEGVVH
jgi:hypothetical protein